MKCSEALILQPAQKIFSGFLILKAHPQFLEDRSLAFAHSLVTNSKYFGNLNFSLSLPKDLHNEPVVGFG
jgi:hypothetical protein